MPNRSNPVPEGSTFKAFVNGELKEFPKGTERSGLTEHNIKSMNAKRIIQAMIDKDNARLSNS